MTLKRVNKSENYGQKSQTAGERYIQVEQKCQWQEEAGHRVAWADFSTIDALSQKNWRFNENVKCVGDVSGNG